MSEERDLEKLRVLLAHWAEHNREHAEEFRRWAERVEQLGVKEVASNLRAAVEDMEIASNRLGAALDQLGGPARHHS
jgi:hypothetical protein